MDAMGAKSVFTWGRVPREKSGENLAGLHGCSSSVVVLNLASVLALFMNVARP